MKKLLAACASILLATPLTGQSVDLSTPGAWTQTWFGCDPGRSCYWVNLQASPVGDIWLGTLHHRAWAFFETADAAFFHLAGYEVGSSWVTQYYNEGSDPYFPQFRGNLPERLGVDIWYTGPHLPEGWERTRIDLNKIAEHRTVTPEPASLLLVATAIGGLAAARRRRGKVGGA